MKRKIKVKSNRKVRHERIRKTISGTSEKPRLMVTRSLKNLEVQLVNDLEQKTVFSLSTRDKEFSSKAKYRGNVQAAVELGEQFGKAAQKKGFKAVVFDRGGYQYHGRVKAFADSARKAGLEF